MPLNRNVHRPVEQLSCLSAVGDADVICKTKDTEGEQNLSWVLITNGAGNIWSSSANTREASLPCTHV